MSTLQLSEVTDPELITACLHGNNDAWETLVRRYRRLVYSIPHKWGLDAQDADEIFQNVWLDCFRELASLRNLESLPPWLIRITIRKCHRFCESKDTAFRVSLGLDGSLTGEDAGLADDSSRELIRRVELEQLIRTAVERLSPRCQQMIHCLFLEEPLPTYAEVAARLGLSPNSIGFTRDRCLERMGRILEELGYDG